MLTDEEIKMFDIHCIKIQNTKLGTLFDSNNNIIFTIAIPKHSISLPVKYLMQVKKNDDKKKTKTLKFCHH